MAEALQSLTQALRDAPSEFDSFDQKLRSSLDPVVYGQFVDLHTKLASAATQRVWNVVGNRCNRISELTNPEPQGNAPDQERSKINLIFEQINPGPIAEELKKACYSDLIQPSYSQILNKLEKQEDIGKIAKRYHLPNEVVSALTYSCMIPLQPALSALGIHAAQLRAHCDTLKRLSSTKGIRTGVNVVSTIAGGVLLGPLGAMGARILTGAISDPSTKINESTTRVFGTFDEFRSTFVKGMQTVETNVDCTLMAIYGGLLLRIEQDLNALGRRFESIDFLTGEVTLTLSQKVKEDYIRWAQEKVLQLKEVKKNENWGLLGDLSEKSLAFTLADPLRSYVPGPDKETSYSVIFARYRAIALNEVAKQAWKAGRKNDACALYRHLLRGTNLAWERTNKGKIMPNNEAIHIAGLRLAINATLEKDKPNLNDLAVLPCFVIQALSRFSSEKIYVSSPGEALTGTTIMAARIITFFAEEKSYYLSLKKRLKGIQLPTLNRELMELNSLNLPTASEIYSLVKYVAGEEESDSDQSEFITWVQKRARSERIKNNLTKSAVIISIATGILVGGYFLLSWLF